MLDTETTDDKAVSELGNRQVSLLEVARLVHEQGPQIAENIYSAYREKFDTANPKQQTKIRKEDYPNQIICRQDWSYRTGKLDEKRQILVFIGPQTDIEEVLSQYPRIRFFFKNKGNNESEWEYDHAQVGLTERELSPDVIITPSSEENRARTEIIETKVGIVDLKRVLGKFQS